MITLKNVTLRRGAKVVLDSVSATINPGESVGLVGRNGAGKSSLFALLSGKLHEDGGDFYIPTSWRMAEVAQNMPETDQSATSLQNVGGDPKLGAQNIVDDAGLVNNQYAPAILGETYRDYLPQLNLNFRLTDDDQLRFAAAKVMSRPPINRLASNTSITISDDGEINGNSSNSPFLRPFEATQYDLSYEYYIPSGAIAFALFYKDIKSFVNDFTIQEFDFAAAGFAVPDVIVDEDGIPRETFNGAFSTAVNNGEGGYIRGAELAFTQVFKFLPSYWSGLGVSASYSYTESEIKQQTNLGGSTIDISLPGLSENVFTGTVFWEYDKFETRLSARFRDPFVSEQVAVNEQIVNYDGETVLDFQTSYQVTDKLGVLFQVNNLTDEPTKSYFGDELQTGTIQFFGRQYFFGVTYSM